MKSRKGMRMYKIIAGRCIDLPGTTYDLIVFTVAANNAPKGWNAPPGRSLCTVFAF